MVRTITRMAAIRSWYSKAEEGDEEKQVLANVLEAIEEPTAELAAATKDRFWINYS